MPRIPRLEQSQRVEIAAQPGMSPDALTGPGRALQKLGSAIGSFGGAISDANEKQEQFDGQMAVLRGITELDLAERDYRANYTGDGVGYLDDRNQVFESKRAEILSSVPQSYQKQASLVLERKRGSYLESAHGYQTEVIGAKRFAGTEALIVDGFGAIAAAPPDQFEAEFEKVIKGVNGIIDNAPFSEMQKEQLRARAASIADDLVLKAIPPGGRRQGVQSLIERWSKEMPAPPPGPQSGLAPGKAEIKSGLVSVPGIEVVNGVDPSAPYMRRQRDIKSVSRIILHGDVQEDAERLLQYGRKVDSVRGFDPGYHFYIARDGRVIQGAPLDRVTNHAKSENKDSIGIVVAGADNGKMPTPEQDRATKALIASLGPSLGVDPKNVIGHGELQPGRRNKLEGGTIAADIRKHGYALGGPDTGTSTAELRPTMTAYSPQKGGDKMEGGYASSRPGPDGKAEVRTLADVQAGRSQYVTLAGDPSQYGKTFTIPEITYKDASGKEVTLKNVKGVVHDTGSAFKGKGDQRFDIPVDRDLPSDSLGAQPFSKKRVVFLSGDRSSAEPPPVSQRGLTRVAGLATTQSDASGSADGQQQGGNAARAENTIPGTQVAQAQPRLRPSVQSKVMENWIKKMPMIQAQDEAAVKMMVDRAAKVATEGRMLPDAERAATERALSASGSKELAAQYQIATATAQETAVLRTARPDQIQAYAVQLKAEIAAAGQKATPEQLARADAVDKLAKHVNERLDKDMLAWGQEIGAIPDLPEIDPARMDDEALQARREAANFMAARYGREPQFFSERERDLFATALKKGGDGALAALGQMSLVFKEDMAAAMRELSPKSPEAATAGWLFAGINPEAAREIMATVARRNDPNYKGAKGPARSQSEAAAQAVLGDTFARFPQQQRDSVLMAADALYEARNKATPDKYDETIYKDAVLAVIGQRKNADGKVFGGPVPTRTGYLWGGDKMILLPPNWRADTWRQTLESVTAHDLAEAGLPLPADHAGKPLSAVKIANARLVQIGDGKYRVSLGDPDVPGDEKWVRAIPHDMKPGSAKSDAAAPLNEPVPFEIDLNKLEPVLRKRMPTQFWGRG